MDRGWFLPEAERERGEEVRGGTACPSGVSEKGSGDPVKIDIGRTHDYRSDLSSVDCTQIFVRLARGRAEPP